jgi:hypothetical protein
VKRLLALLLGGLGLRALLQRRAPHPAAGPDPAGELRARLAENRSPEPDPEPVAEPGSVEERRADVHARAREALDELKQ